jgi:hypothetical protein
MAINILDNCMFDSSKIKTLYIGSRLVSGSPISYPIEYTTVSGSSDSIITVTAWDYNNNYVTIGGQQIIVNQITNLGDNLSYTEELVINQSGKNYVKTITFTIPNITLFLINQLKEFTISSAGQFALSPTIAFLIDENDNQVVIGYDKGLYLQDQNFKIGETNEVTLSYVSSSQSRARNYEII